jgi:hypothetical protein
MSPVWFSLMSHKIKPEDYGGIAMKNIEEQLQQIGDLIGFLDDARVLCEGPALTQLLESALEGAETLQHLIVEGEAAAASEERRPGAPGMPQLPVEAASAADVTELCFPV